MEVCDTSSVSPCFAGRSYTRQPYDLSQPSSATPGLPITYAPYAYTTTNDQHITQNALPQLTCPSAIQCRGAIYPKALSNMYETHGHKFCTHNSLFSSGLYQAMVSPATASISSLAAGKNYSVTCNGRSVFEQMKSFDTLPSDSTKNTEPWSVNASPQMQADTAKLKNVLEVPSTELLLQHVQNLSQWDVNDPKLPKIRQFDTFTMWPQGQCRYAFQKSASDGARRHASGWAMRNTNNHNAQILKKSCLGVLLCTAKGCSLAMRPAICDKARRRQEGRPCCMPSCTGRIYNQSCRGHGGYPVTHFWREHGDTVYFQAKGTHDHIRPDLKPVRDTAARRRRQLQLEKMHSQHHGTKCNQTLEDTSVKTLKQTVRDPAKSCPIPVQSRKRVITEAEIKVSCTRRDDTHEHTPSTFHVPGQDALIGWKIQEYPYVRMEYKQPCSTDHNTTSTQQTFSLSPSPQKAEPIFPSSPSFAAVPTVRNSSYYANSVNQKSSPSTKFATITRTETPITFTQTFSTGCPVPLKRMHHSSEDPFAAFYGLNTLPNNYTSSQYGLDMTDRSNQVNYQAALHGAFTKDLYEQDVKSEELPFEVQSDPQQSKPNIPPGFQTNLTPMSLYKQQMFQAYAGQNGTTSESTSGGLNASWSTPSPPTGGNSSLFGSEFRTVHSVIDDATSHNPGNLIADAKDAQSGLPTLSTSSLWRMDNFTMMPKPVTSAHVNMGVYGLATPTHAYGATPGNNHESSPEELLTPSALMSSSTPLSNNQVAHRLASQLAQSGAYRSNYITPIPLYLNSSDSRSTHTSSSTGGASQ
ncbi:chorion-specific transcription factor GCM [Paragonimus westermani]|uniref:Chorion-specific transcription factor GCM n=1 Tax=Paragonimus westermani TaxID=34504 RepID=A0A5J4NIR3_9TREM|nr:chorion-specific transcription factor GCM [Paragonimus westermani]